MSPTHRFSPSLESIWFGFSWSGILWTQAIKVFHGKIPSRIPVKPCFYQGDPKKSGLEDDPFDCF